MHVMAHEVCTGFHLAVSFANLYYIYRDVTRLCSIWVSQLHVYTKTMIHNNDLHTQNVYIMFHVACATSRIGLFVAKPLCELKMAYIYIYIYMYIYIIKPMGKF